MCKINFVSEFNCFMRYAKNNSLTGRERNLWIALFYIANDRANYNAATKDYEWPDEFFPVTIGELTLHSNLDKKSIEAIRNQLKQRGLIEFEKGKGNVKPAKYKINYLSLDVGYKIVPNDPPYTPPNSTPYTPPNSTPYTPTIYKDIDIGIDIGENEIKKIYDVDDLAHAGAASAVDSYLHWNGLDLNAYLGMTEDVKKLVKIYTASIFSQFTSRDATAIDEAYVFCHTRVFQDGQWRYLDSEKIKLLCYCFEQAAKKGTPGNWQYIEGCIAKLNQRGIETLADAEDYEEYAV